MSGVVVAEKNGRAGVRVSNGVARVKLQELPAVYSLESERAVLGAMLSDPECVMDVVLEKGLREDDFFSAPHREFFKLLFGMFEESVPIDVMTVMQWVRDRGLEEAIGGLGMLGDLAASAIAVLTVRTHVDVVLQKSHLRQLQTACAGIVYDIHMRGHEAVSVLEGAEGAIVRVMDRVLGLGGSEGGREVSSVGECVDEFVERSLGLVGKKNLFNGVPTGFYQLDMMLNGFQPGEYIVVAAEPGLGKTAFMLNILLNMARRKKNADTGEWMKPGYRCGVFSIEMTREQLVKRLVSTHGAMRSGKVRSPQFWKPEDVELVREAQESLREMPIWIDASPVLTPEKLRMRARWMKRRYDVEMLFLDYLQLMTLNERVTGDIETVTTMKASHAIRQTAKELNVPFFVLVQLNKEGLKAENPELHNIKGSAQIIQDAHCILMMQEDPKDKKERRPGDPVKIILKVKKARESERGCYVKFEYQGEFYWFKEAQREESCGREPY